MANKTVTRWVMVCLCICMFRPLTRAADLSADDVVAKHLASIGTPEARNAKSRVTEGSVSYKILVGGSGQAEGKAVFVSEGVKRQLLMKINDRNYRGEQIIFDGSKVQVTFSLTQQKRSQFGEFLFTQPVPLSEGLLGGLLTTAWPLLDIAAREAKLTYQGLKKVDGQELHDLLYRPKKGTDYEIHLYFDSETFRHVLSVYTITIQPQMRFGGDARNVRQNPERHRIEEHFSDFKQSDGLTLPNHYELKYTQELQTGGTALFVWDVAVSQITNNQSVDPRNFEVK